MYLPTEVNTTNCRTSANVLQCAEQIGEEAKEGEGPFLPRNTPAPRVPPAVKESCHALNGSGNLPQTSVEGPDLESGRECWTHGAVLEWICSRCSHCSVSVIAVHLSVPLLLSAEIRKTKLCLWTETIQIPFTGFAHLFSCISTTLVIAVSEHLTITLIKPVTLHNRSVVLPLSFHE